MKRPWRLEEPKRDRNLNPIPDQWRVVATYQTEERAEAARQTYRNASSLRVRKHVSFEASE